MKLTIIFSVLLCMCVLSIVLMAAEGKKDKRHKGLQEHQRRSSNGCDKGKGGRKHRSRGRSQPCLTDRPPLPSDPPSGLGGSASQQASDRSAKRSKPVKDPYSGQRIKLVNHDNYHNLGVVSVYLGGAWGHICSENWDIRDADVACRQLGFPRALSATDNSSVAGGGRIVMGKVRCSGTEAALQQCQYRPTHHCPSHQAATVTCEESPGCPEGWNPGFGKCYKLFAQVKNIKLAAGICAMQKASLVNVLSKEENHFLSNFVTNFAPEIHEWHTGAVIRKGKWKWYKLIETRPRVNKRPSSKWRRTSRFKTVSSSVTEEMWFPGWPSHGNRHTEPSNQSRDICLTLSNRYRSPNGGLVDLDYFFWKADWCNKMYGINFICQIELEESHKEKAVRLVGGNEHSGTVEITYKGSTGVICDDKWDMADASVICRMLGYRTAKKGFVGNYFNYPTNKAEFLLDDVKCQGNETFIWDCKASPFKIHNCQAFEIAGVECQLSEVCEIDQFTCLNGKCVKAKHVCDGKRHCEDGSDEDNCNSYAVKLLNGSTPWEGRVQVTVAGLSGSVCDDQWDNLDAQVVCRTLGMNYGGVALSGASFGQGSGPVWMDNVQCGGDEESLDKCPHRGWGVHDCVHLQDASVRCFTSIQTAATEQLPTLPPTLDFTTMMMMKTSPNSQTGTPTIMQMIQLVGGQSEHMGNIALNIDGISYRVCDNHWNNDGATVVCRMLGYSLGGFATINSYFGTGNNEIILDDINCIGTENSLDECDLTFGTEEHDCNNDQFAGVICTQNVEPTDAPEITVEPVPTHGFCGQRPYDKLDLLNRKRRSLSYITTNFDKWGEPSIQSIFNEEFETELKRGQSRIAGGNLVPHGKYPWQVGIQLLLSVLANGSIFTTHHCGGTVISEHWIVSAAHCFTGKKKTQIRILVGDHNNRLTDRGEQVFEVEDMVLHKNFSTMTFDNDIALLKVKKINGKGIVFSNFVQPACLPTPTTQYKEGTMCDISGWGKTGSDKSDPSPTILRAVSVPLIGLEKCRYLYTHDKEVFFSRRMMCAGYMEGGRDACRGDSGGPLVCKIKGAYTLMGITSWGFGCARPNAPGVYSLVQEFLPWIYDNLREHSSSTIEKTLPLPSGAS